MFRWKGIIVIIVIFALIFLISLLLTDRFIENNLEDFGSAIVGAKVEIDDLNLSLIGMKASWKRLQVTHPKQTMKNMIETDTCDFNLEFWPLFSKKLIVENFQIRGIRTFTDRETDGALSKDERAQKSGFLAEAILHLSKEAETSSNTTLTGFKQQINVDSIMSLINIQSVKNIDSLQSALVQNYDSWSKKLSELKLEQDVKDIEAKIKTIDVEKIKKVDQLQKSLKTAKSIKKDVEELNDEFKTTKKDLQSDIKQAQGSLNMVDDWVKADYDRARSMAKLPDFSMQNIAKMIFGQQVVERFNQYLGYAATTRQYAEKFKSTKPEKEEPPRLKGQDIYFYNKNARPDFWIKQISLSGVTSDQLNLKGTINNVVSDQTLIQKTTDIDLSGKNKSGAKLAFKGTLDYLEEKPKETFDVSYDGFSLAKTKLSDSNLLPNQVAKGVGSVKTSLNLVGDGVEGKIKFLGQNIAFDFKENDSKTQVERIVQNVLQDINTVDFSAKIKGTNDNLILSISSSLDEMFAKSLKSTLNKEVEAAKQKIQSRIDKEVKKYRDDLDRVIKEKEGQLQAELKKYQDMVDTEVKKVEAKQKEIEDKIETEKKKLEKDAKNKLKKLFK